MLEDTQYSSPFISVVIPTCNRPDLLARCLDRLESTNQSLAFRVSEVIVTDDSDAEDTMRLVTKRYTWCHYTAGPKRGPAANRNCGASHAIGHWLAFTDDDCIPGHDWLSALHYAARKEVAVVLEGRTTCEEGICSPLFQAPVNLTGGWLWSCNLAVRSDVFRQLGGFCEAYPQPHMEDVDFRERVRAKGLGVRFVPEAAVDHPPRRIAPPAKRAAYHESEMIFYALRGRQLSFIRMAARIAISRIRVVRTYWPNRDCLKASWEAVCELVLVGWHYRAWQRRLSALTTTTNPRANVRVMD